MMISSIRAGVTLGLFVLLIFAANDANAGRVDYSECRRHTTDTSLTPNPNARMISTNGLCPDSARYPIVRDRVDVRAPAFRCALPRGMICYFNVFDRFKPIEFFQVNGGKVYHDSYTKLGTATMCGCINVPVPMNSCSVPAYICKGPTLVRKMNVLRP
jgi:hypothetical protein